MTGKSQLKSNRRFFALVAAGLITLEPNLSAEEAKSQQLLTALSATTVSGYVDTSLIWKFGSGNGGTGVGAPPSGGAFPGRSYDGTPKQDGFNLNVVALTLNQPPTEEAWSAGYNATLLFGPDAVGYNPSVSAGTPDFSLKDTYVQLRAPLGNGIDFKIGSFTEIIGYEVFESGTNPNYSRSYGYFIEPTQLTGVLASYQLNDVVGVLSGVANSWLPGVNARATRASAAAAESEKTYMGLISLTAPERFGLLKGATLSVGVIDGLAGGASDTTSIYAGGTAPTPLEGLSLGAAWEYRGTKERAGIASTYANAASLYLFYQATPKLKFASRTEYASGSAGTWYVVSLAESDPHNEVFAWTFTADYGLWANVISRAEFRWDHDLTGQANGSGIFGRDDRNTLSLALNLIYKF